MENSVLDRKQVEVIRDALRRQAAADRVFVESGDYEACMLFLDCVEMSLQ